MGHVLVFNPIKHPVPPRQIYYEGRECNAPTAGHLFPFSRLGLAHSASTMRSSGATPHQVARLLQNTDSAQCERIRGWHSGSRTL